MYWHNDQFVNDTDKFLCCYNTYSLNFCDAVSKRVIYRNIFIILVYYLFSKFNLYLLLLEVIYPFGVFSFVGTVIANARKISVLHSDLLKLVSIFCSKLMDTLSIITQYSASSRRRPVRKNLHLYNQKPVWESVLCKLLNHSRKNCLGYTGTRFQLNSITE